MIDKALGLREQTARNIARAEGFPIIDKNDDWTFFTLDDGQPIGSEGSDGHGFLASRTIRTHFNWVEEAEEDGRMFGRFEGFVS